MLREQITAAERQALEVGSREQIVRQQESVDVPRARHMISLYANISSIRWDYGSENLKGFITSADGNGIRSFELVRRCARRPSTFSQADGGATHAGPKGELEFRDCKPAVGLDGCVSRARRAAAAAPLRTLGVLRCGVRPCVVVSLSADAGG